MSTVHTLAYFQGLHQKTGTINIQDGQTLEITLNEVVPKERTPEGWESFTLMFTTPAKGILENGLATIHFEGEEPLPIFLVPVEADEEVVEYEAIFNRKLES